MARRHPTRPCASDSKSGGMGGGYTNVDPNVRRIIPDAKGRVVVKAGPNAPSPLTHLRSIPSISFLET